MTEGKQSNNTKEKVSYILVVQDLDITTAVTYGTSDNVEQHKKSLRGGGSTSGSFTILYSTMLCCSRPLSTHNHIIAIVSSISAFDNSIAQQVL